MTSRREQLDLQRNPHLQAPKHKCACGTYTGHKAIDLVDGWGVHSADSCLQHSKSGPPTECACGRVKRKRWSKPVYIRNTMLLRTEHTPTGCSKYSRVQGQWLKVMAP